MTLSYHQKAMRPLPLSWVRIPLRMLPKCFMTEILTPDNALIFFFLVKVCLMYATSWCRVVWVTLAGMENKSILLFPPTALAGKRRVISPTKNMGCVFTPVSVSQPVKKWVLVIGSPIFATNHQANYSLISDRDRIGFINLVFGLKLNKKSENDLAIFQIVAPYYSRTKIAIYNL